MAQANDKFDDLVKGISEEWAGATKTSDELYGDAPKEPPAEEESRDEVDMFDAAAIDLATVIHAAWNEWRRDLNPQVADEAAYSVIETLQDLGFKGFIDHYNKEQTDYVR